MVVNPVSIKKIAIALAIVSLVAMGTFGLAFGMDMGSRGSMAPCPFMGVAAICNMTPLEHVAAMQSMFTATANASCALQLLLQLLLLAATIVAAFLTMRRVFEAALGLFASRQRLYLRYSYAYAYAHPLQQAFARGILHPKIY